MTTPWMLAAIHLLGLGLALGSVWARGRALRGVLDAGGVRRVLVADNWWGVSAIVLIGTGLVRAFAGMEKGTAYYLGNHLFLTKLALVGAILILEVGPMIGLVRWRVALGRGEAPELGLAGRYAVISQVQAVLVAIIVFLASGVARGFGAAGGN